MRLSPPAHFPRSPSPTGTTRRPSAPSSTLCAGARWPRRREDPPGPVPGRHRDRGLPARTGGQGPGDAAGEPAGRGRCRLRQDDRGRPGGPGDVAAPPAVGSSSSARVPDAQVAGGDDGKFGLSFPWSTLPSSRELRRNTAWRPTRSPFTPGRYQPAVATEPRVQRLLDEVLRFPRGSARLLRPAHRRRSPPLRPPGRPRDAGSPSIASRPRPSGACREHSQHRLFLSATPHNGYS